jgi:hypothetical protein
MSASEDSQTQVWFSLLLTLATSGLSGSAWTRNDLLHYQGAPSACSAENIPPGIDFRPQDVELLIVWFDRSAQGIAHFQLEASG